ncbi:monocarboxylate transporter 12-like [Patiria miniata]|uniref:Major facilitator superfamily (MFS) profile domain-containing protein n=1 Tax=Patiria miniata TaxID=46514 RepID=A0A913ZX59_PATMI|nr:monocarboxylate transporter 12-like [Patiria miniata]
MGEATGPDGGLMGWIAVLAWWTNNFMWVGITKGLGIMLPTLKQQLVSQTWIIGWIVALVIAMFGFVAPFADLFRRWFGAPYIIMTCSAMISAAAIAASFAQTTLQLALLFVLMAGTGWGILNVVAKEAVGRCFTKNYATANGIARTGYSAGLFVFTPLVQLFLDTYGWRGTTLLIGGIMSHGVVCGALMVTKGAADSTKPKTDYQYLAGKNESSASRGTTVPSRCCASWEKVSGSLNLGLMCSARYWSVAIIFCTTNFAYDMWIVYFVTHALAQGFTIQDASHFILVAGIGNLVSKVVQGSVTDRGLAPSWCMSAVATVVGSVSLCGTALTTSYWTMMAVSLVMLTSNGVIFSQTDVLVKQVLGVELLAGAFGWIELKAAVLATAFGFLPGWMYDTTGSFTAAFIMLGFVQGVSLIPLLSLGYLKIVK